MRETIFTKNAPAPIGPYSQGVRFGNTYYFSGQIALDPATGNFVSETDVKLQTQQVMKNIHALLTESGLTFDNIVKTSIFLKSMNDFPLVNEEYAKSFSSGVYPARETVQVAKLPRNVNVEISMIVEV
jgi:2-iminobutanoate/2-iminopropanoate deaminase